MKACVIGASGYTGRELVKLLLAHPKVELSVITSRSLAGQPVEKVIPQVTGIANGLLFSNPSVEELCGQQDLDIFFWPYPTVLRPLMPLLSWQQIKKSLIYQPISVSTPLRLTKSSMARSIRQKSFFQKPNTVFPNLRAKLGKVQTYCFSRLLPHKYSYPPCTSFKKQFNFRLRYCG